VVPDVPAMVGMNAREVSGMTDGEWYQLTPKGLTALGLQELSKLIEDYPEDTLLAALTAIGSILGAIAYLLDERLDT
jgi:hypothetical protein